VERAKEGDVSALRLCVERLLPVRKERLIELPPRRMEHPAVTPLTHQDILTAGASRITPAEGQALSNILTGHAQTLEALEFLRRVQDLETPFQQIASIAPNPLFGMPSEL
jgi:hypothetical protein